MVHGRRIVLRGLLLEAVLYGEKKIEEWLADCVDWYG